MQKRPKCQSGTNELNNNSLKIMQKTKIIQKMPIRFRRYCRAKYAVFCSMHRVINIGRLASYIADQQMHKSALLLPLMFWCFSASVAEAQTDDLMELQSLPVLDITATLDSTAGSPDAVVVISKKDLSGLTVGSIGELLEQLPGVDVRKRGANDVQQDLSMRGGTFDQVVVMINGVNITDAQTGHHNLDVPIDLSMVERVEIIPASALLKYGVSSFAGAVNIVTSSHRNGQERGRILLEGGRWGHAKVVAGLTQQVGSWSLLGVTSYSRSSGYMDNTDYSYGNLWLQADKQAKNGTWDIQLGGQLKGFGSMAFYSLKYPNQYENTRTLSASVCRRFEVQGWQMELLLYGRLHKDRFELFRDGYVEAPSWYVSHNYHLSNTEGFRFRTSKWWQLGLATLGLDWRREAIVSTVLGDTLEHPLPVVSEPGNHQYNLGIGRNKMTLFAAQEMQYRQWKLNVSLLGSLINLDPYYGYSLELERPLFEGAKVGASWVRSFRVPTYTDLYYHSATQVSNPQLRPERSHTADLWFKYRKNHLSLTAEAYGRRGSNMIDWVRQPGEEVWYSMNHARIDALGVDGILSYSLSGILRQLSVGYSYCYVNQQSDEFVSNYVLDYLRQKFSAAIMLSPIKGMRVKLLTDYYVREGAYTNSQNELVNYTPVTMLNACVEYDVWKQHAVLFVEGYNLLNKTYCDYGGVPQPGVMVLGGIRLSL